MKRTLIAAALAAAYLSQVFPAVAAPDAAKHRLLVALERLANPRATPNTPLVTRSASVSVTGTVRIVSPGLPMPLFCSVVFQSFDPNTSQFRRETKTKEVAVSGGIGTCSMTIPFKWTGVTDFLDVPIFVEVSNWQRSVRAESAAPQVLTTSLFDGPSLPLALEGEDIHFTFDIRI